MLKRQETKKISRKELYDLVWSKPIMDVAKQFGISDRGLGKVCERYDIPKPPRGYWQRISAGERISIPKLKAKDNIYQETVCIQVNTKETASNNVNAKVNNKLKNPIILPEKVDKLHKLVKQTEKSVRAELRDRRNLILNALFLKLEENGLEIEIKGECFRLIFEKERIYLKIREYLKESKRPLTEQEAKKKAFMYQKWYYEYEATGKLKLTLHEYEPDSYSGSIYASFIDKKGVLIEESINDIYTNILQMLLIKREKSIKEEKERKIREEREKQERIRKKKIEILLEETQGYVLARNIRDYIASKEKAYKAGNVKMINFDEWKTFGLEYVDSIDTSLKPEKEVVDDYNKYNWY